MPFFWKVCERILIVLCQHDVQTVQKVRQNGARVKSAWGIFSRTLRVAPRDATRLSCREFEKEGNALREGNEASALIFKKGEACPSLEREL